MTADDFRALALALPSVEEGFNMGSPVFKANGKVLARLLGERRAMLAGYAPDEIDIMTAADPTRFSADAHFRSAGCVVLHLDGADPDEALALLKRRFIQIAKKSVLRAWPP
jgi:hypothetical protein